MIVDKPNFTDSELYLIEDIVKEDKQRWMDKFKNSPDFEEISNEYDSILNKLKTWRKEEHTCRNAIDSLFKL